MKLILLAAAAVIAAPVLAQTTTTAPMPQDNATTAPPTTQTTPPSTTPTDPMMTAPASTTQSMDPAGGYQPANNAMSGPMQPGATVRFQQAPTPSEAFPAPAPMASYPMCRPGQTNHCRERENARGMGVHDGTPRHESRRHPS